MGEKGVEVKEWTRRTGEVGGVTQFYMYGVEGSGCSVLCCVLARCCPAEGVLNVSELPLRYHVPFAFCGLHRRPTRSAPYPSLVT